MNILKHIIFLFLSFFITICFAFSESLEGQSSATKKNKGEFLIEEDFFSNTSYQGRTDSTYDPLLCSYFKYTTPLKFYFAGNMVHGSKSKLFDEFDLSIGKKIKFTDSWSGKLNITHIFSDSKAGRIKSSISNYASAYMALDWSILYSSIAFDYSLGTLSSGKKKGLTSKSEHDICFTLSNSHDFFIDNIFDADDELTISPGLDVLYGTQNFLARYNGRKDVLFQSAASQVQLLAYQFSLDISYELGNFGFDIYPFINIPKNVPQNWKSSSAFLLELSLYYTISKK